MKKSKKNSANNSSLTEKFRKGNLFAAPCPSRHVLKHVCSQWGLLALMALRNEPVMRFSELRRKLGGVSEKMLAQSLQALVTDGFVNRTAYPVVPPHVEYSLTEMGKEVVEHVAKLADWIECNMPRVMEAQQTGGERTL
ncbi:winged helix-turn-helix transcriptional regulator [Desulfogranum japonicum]|uniref:winged helix-turn-helix transcriptional regulator n=1 Tax=Desulfogranum japonicum TaxID=231447 RepID=UPI000551D6F5|nr:helix-turn-helix domain-containing protein [Desulfogranum japonicum]